MKVAAALALIAFGLTGIAQAHPLAGTIPQDRDLTVQIIRYERAINAEPEGSDRQNRLIEQQNTLLQQLQSEDQAGYETVRENMYRQAPTISSALRWADEDTDNVVEDLQVGTENGYHEEEAQRQFDSPFAGLIDGISTGGSTVLINVYKDGRTFEMTVNGEKTDGGPIATARPGYSTPNGCRHPWLLNAKQYSYKYHAPMPYSVFFLKSIALHSGNPNVQSHGCVHLLAGSAQNVFNTVAKYGMKNTLVCVYGSGSGSGRVTRKPAHKPTPRRRRQNSNSNSQENNGGAPTQNQSNGNAGGSFFPNW